MTKGLLNALETLPHLITPNMLFHKIGEKKINEVILIASRHIVTRLKKLKW